MEFHERLMFPALTVADRDAVLAELGNAVIDAGFAHDDYVRALREREAQFPTGLPISGGVAIPHTSNECVATNTIACATLTQPVMFHEMGDDESEVEVSTVFMLVVADGQQQVTVLSSLVKKLRDAEFIDGLRTAPDAQSMKRILASMFST